MMRAFSVAFDLLAIVSVVAALFIVLANLASLPAIFLVIRSVLH
jgi:hypothetical protein